MESIMAITMANVDYYEILGVSSNATDVEIKRAYRRLSLELHPDRNTGCDTEAKYKQVVEAYNILGDKAKRSEYNKIYKDKNQPNRLTSKSPRNDYYNETIPKTRYRNNYGEWDDDEDYDDDGPIRWKDRNERIRYPINTRIMLDDIKHTITITMEESFTGVSVPLSIQRNINGVLEEALLYIDIPEGTDNGEIIVMEGKGNIKGSFRSHIRVKVNIEPHRYFKRDKLNVVYELDISLKEALCGFKKEITHLDGKQYLIGNERGKIMQQGAKRCITGKGFQRGQNIGNLLIIFNIIMPRSLTNEQIETIERLKLLV
jgi:DnaJ-class molecular chaperone